MNRRSLTPKRCRAAPALTTKAGDCRNRARECQGNCCYAAVINITLWRIYYTRPVYYIQMKNITVTLDEETAAWARTYAAQQNKSLSRYLGELLNDTMRESH